MRGRQRKKTCWKLDDKGVSLIEIIVIVLILGVVSGSVIVGVSMARSHDAMRCAKNIATSLERTRAEALSKTDGSIHLELSAKPDGYYATLTYISGGVSKIEDEIKVGTRAVTIKVHESGATKELGVDVMRISFSFSKSTGAFLDSYYDYIIKVDNIEKIEVIGSDIADVELVKETGRSFVSPR